MTLNGELDEDLDGAYNDTGTGSDNSINISDVITSLWLVDSTGTTVGTGESFSSIGDATFSGMTFVIPSGTTKTVNAYGDISSSAPYNGTNDKVAINIIKASRLITAKTGMGAPASATGTMVNGPQNSPTVYMTITSGGDLTIAEDTSHLDNQIAEQESNDLLVGRYTLTATDEDWELNTITFTPTDSSNTAGSSSTRADNIESLTLLYPTSLSSPTTLDGSSTAYMTGTNATFSSLSAMIPTSHSVTIELYADLTAHTLDGGSLDSDDSFNMTVNTSDKNANGEVDAIGLSSGTAKTESDFSDVTASNTTYVYRTIPTVSNATGIGSSLTIGENQEVYRFNVTAGVEDITLGYISLDVNPSGLVTGATTQSLSNNTYGSAEDAYSTYGFCGGSTIYTTAPWYVIDDSTGNVVGTGCYDAYHRTAKIEMLVNNSNYLCTIWSCVGTSGVTIASESTKTFKVYADIFEDADPSTTTSISTKLHEDTTHIATNTFDIIRTTSDAYSGSTTTGMIWSDNGSTTSIHGLGIAEWMNGYKVPGMPVSYITLSR